MKKIIILVEIFSSLEIESVNIQLIDKFPNRYICKKIVCL